MESNEIVPDAQATMTRTATDDEVRVGAEVAASGVAQDVTPRGDAEGHDSGANEAMTPEDVEPSATPQQPQHEVKIETEGEAAGETANNELATLASVEAAALTQSELLLLTDDGNIEPAAAATTVAPSTADKAVMQLSMQDLFGELFQYDASTDTVADPALVDTRGILLSNFGACVAETDIVFANEALLQREMAANKEARHRAEMERLFGEVGADVLAEERIERFTLLHATVPPSLGLATPHTPPAASAAIDESAGASQQAEDVWLVEMPKVTPNRQILHADPQPFFPSRCTRLVSDARMLFTPCNVMRWAYQKSRGLFLSNTRLVRWSDGSVTLHVGSDVHSLQPARANATLDLLGGDSLLSQHGVVLPAVATTLHPREHFVIEPSNAASIERAIVEEGQQHRTVATKLKLPYAPLAMPPIDWSKPHRGRNLYEEFVAREYERREKELAKRHREGRPMSLAEQIAREQEMMTHLRHTDAETLREEQTQQELHAQTSRSAAQPPRRSRFDRDLGLTDGQASAFDMDEAGEVQDRAGGEEGSEDDDADYEAMLEDMRRKRAREQDADAAERRSKMAHYEESQRERFRPLMDALVALLPGLTMGTDAYASVDGTVEFLRSGSFAAGIVEKEIPLMLKEIAVEAPSVDTAAVAAAYQAIFAHAL